MTSCLHQSGSDPLNSALRWAGSLLLMVIAVELCGCTGSSKESASLSAGTCEESGEIPCPEGCGALCALDLSACQCAGSTTTTVGTGSTETGESSTNSTGNSTGNSTADEGTTTSEGGTTTSEGGTTTTDGVSTSEGGTTTGGTDGTTGDSSSTGTTTMGWQEAQHVHIDIDNFCQVSVDPPEIWVPVDEIVELTYHNHSVDYQADVWLSYGGGYLELELGDSWEDPFQWCSGPNASLGYADISIAGGGNNSCPAYRLNIHCE